MNLDVVTPEGSKLTDLEILEITLPGTMGEMGIMPGHVTMMASLDAGPMTVMTGTGSELYAISSGYVEVLDDKVRVLTETCEKSDEIDVERARDKLATANERIEGLSTSDGESYLVALNSVKKHETRIRVVGEGKSLS